MTIRNPIEWGMSQVKLASHAIEEASHGIYRADESPNSLAPEIRHISARDVRDALMKGLDDFRAYRTDVIFLTLIYPIIGLVLGRLAFGTDTLPLLFPIASGFALIGPLAAIGLYEMSRRREQGAMIAWSDTLKLVHAPSFGAILMLGLMLVVIYLVWLVAAETIYMVTLGPEPPVSIGAFVHDVFTTVAGWTMIVVGMGVGAIFAVLVLAISVFAFPLLLDREVGVDTAVWTSIRAVAANPGPMAVWGLVVSAGLLLGSLPAFIGLMIVLPVLGHATWHLYRRVVPH